MAQTTSRPQLVSPRTAAPTIDASRGTGGVYDIDFYHAMDKRDETLIEQELLHGAGSPLFVYEFKIQGTTVTGISVVGARHIAATYGGLRHRLVASVQKTGELFTFTSYPAKDMPMQVSCAVIPELGGEEDFYGAVVEVADIKTGNAIQIERRENRFETTRGGSRYERPNFSTIAQSKAYRNAILGLIPQDVQIRWKAEMLKLGKGEVITNSVLDEKRGAVLRFAARQGLVVDRRAVDELTIDQIAGLGDAARTEELGAFVNAARSLGLDMAQGETGEVVAQAQPSQQKPRQGQQPREEPPPPTEDQRESDAETEQSTSPATEDPGRQVAGDGQTKPAAVAGEPQSEKEAARQRIDEKKRTHAGQRAEPSPPQGEIHDLYE